MPSPSSPLSRDEIVLQLRRAITVRDALRPGSPRHWRASCEVRVLQRLLVTAAPPPLPTDASGGAPGEATSVPGVA